MVGKRRAIHFEWCLEVEKGESERVITKAQETAQVSSAAAHNIHIGYMKLKPMTL